MIYEIMETKRTTMKQLKGIDENTVVHCTTKELSDKVLKIAKDAGCSPFLVNSMYCHYEKDTCYNLMNATFSNISYYKNIKEYKILPAEEFIKLNTSEETGELIGYEAPFDIPKWNTKKGDLWTYTKNGWYEFKDEALPAEWVETWKPVYKAKEKKRVVKSCWRVKEHDYSTSEVVDKGCFPTKPDCMEWVKKFGVLNKEYTYHEVDYITEE